MNINYYISYNCYNSYYINISPDEFLDCKDRNDVKEAVTELILDEYSYDEVNELSFDIPESFYKEWERLKNENS